MCTHRNSRHTYIYAQILKTSARIITEENQHAHKSIRTYLKLSRVFQHAHADILRNIHTHTLTEKDKHGQKEMQTHTYSIISRIFKRKHAVTLKNVH